MRGKRVGTRLLRLLQCLCSATVADVSLRSLALGSEWLKMDELATVVELVGCT